MKSALNYNQALKDKFEEADKTKVNDAITAAQQWFESNQDSSAEEYEAKRKELEAVYNPIIQKVYQAAGGAPGGMPGGMGGGMPGGGMPGGMGGMPGGMGGMPNFGAQNPSANQGSGTNVDDVD